MSRAEKALAIAAVGILTFSCCCHVALIAQVLGAPVSVQVALAVVPAVAAAAVFAAYLNWAALVKLMSGGQS